MILGIVVGALLPHRIRRIADDDPQGRFFLGLDPRRIVREELGKQLLIGLAQLEGVGQADAVEGGVTGASSDVVEGVFDVDRRNVVGQQHQLVGVDFVLVFAAHVGRADQAALEQARDKGAGAGEWVEDVHRLVAQALAEFLCEHVVDGTNDEVDHFDRRIDDAQLLDHFGEGGFEKLVVELDDDALLAGGVVDAGGSHAHRLVELLQGLVVGGHGLVFEQVEHGLHRLRDGVAFDERIALKQGLEDRPRDDVLRQHFDGLGLADAGVDV